MSWNMQNKLYTIEFGLQILHTVNVTLSSFTSVTYFTMQDITLYTLTTHFFLFLCMLLAN